MFLRHFLEKLRTCLQYSKTYNPYSPQKAYIKEFLKFYTKDFNK